MNINVNCFIGGTQVNEDIKVLNEGTHLAIGTPDVYDLMERDHFNTSHMKAFVIDEADQMLATDFYDKYIEYLPKYLKILGFVCSVQIIIRCNGDYASFYERRYQILVKAKEFTLEGIKQFYVDVDREDWKLSIMYIYQKIKIRKQLFTNSQKKCDYIHIN